jgi:hypothetical protein
MRLTVVLAATLLLASCLSSSSKSHFQTEHEACSVQPELVGQWKSRRPSQLGPATMVLTLGCDCRYTMRVSGLFGRITEDGEFRAESDRLVMSRSKSETAWPYQFAGDDLLLTEAADEAHAYKLVRKLRCPS